MGSKQSTTSGASASEETPSSTAYTRDYRAADAAESSGEDRARRSLAALFTSSSSSNNHHHHQAVLHDNQQSPFLFNPFGVRPSASTHNSHNNHDNNSISGLESGPFAHSLQSYFLPSLFSNPFMKCPFCSKTIMPDDAEVHLVMCITKPQLTYNEDILTEDKGECVICFEEMLSGNKIARLPCLCIYHKTCIDNWFQINRSCPEHPSLD